jgi:hypothetical protein
MPKKQWFNVLLEQSKTIKVYAEDEYEAQNKAEAKLGAMWMANSVWEDN